MIKIVTFVAAILMSGVSQAALLTNFAGSYGQYKPCTSPTFSSSKCFKLYCDPQGIIAGRMTAFFDVPDIGVPRLDGVRELIMHPAYTGSAEGTNVFLELGRQRTESTVVFQAITPMSPPTGPIELYTYETGDAFPELGSAGALGGFKFLPGDFITIFDTDTQQTITFDHTQLQGVQFPFQDVPEPAAGALAAGMIAAGVARGRGRRRRR
jgi:hypothetical protein